MGIKTYKPTSPSRRNMTGSDFAEITKSTPEKSLLVSLNKTGARNNHGRITVRHQGGGHKRKYRVIDFKRLTLDIPAKVVAIEYDPNRNARIALLHYKNGDKKYIICPRSLKVGVDIASGTNVPICLLYTSPSPRDFEASRMPSSA